MENSLARLGIHFRLCIHFIKLQLLIIEKQVCHYALFSAILN